MWHVTANDSSLKAVAAGCCCCNYWYYWCYCRRGKIFNVPLTRRSNCTFDLRRTWHIRGTFTKLSRSDHQAPLSRAPR